VNRQLYDFEEFEPYEEKFNPLRTDRQARRKRKPRVNPKTDQAVQIKDVAETVGLEGGFEISYTPSKHEAGWLLESLRDFYNQELISDVMALVKGGKEASVYRCAAHPATGETWLATKVYRPRMFRNLRNDQAYRQGRVTLGGNGRAVDPKDTRLQKAIGQKTTLGEQVAHTSWLMHEYTTLELLFAQGAAVPKPIAAGSNAILMQYVGDEYGAAPALNEIDLERDEAQALFDETMRNIELMLQNGRVHGDLSAYNILYWDGGITLIDFPQVVNSHVTRQTHVWGSAVNPDAYPILQRDVTRICEYFQHYGIHHNPVTLSRNLWRRYTDTDPMKRKADESRLEESGQ